MEEFEFHHTCRWDMLNHINLSLIFFIGLLLYFWLLILRCFLLVLKFSSPSQTKLYHSSKDSLIRYSPIRMSLVVSIDFIIKNFDERNNFTLWQKSKRSLCLIRFSKKVEGTTNKLKTISDEDWDKFQIKCMSIIHLCITSNVINNVIDDESIVVIEDKLEKLYLIRKLH